MRENIIVFSHLRWSFVFQRPQHLLSRISTDDSVWFFEEPEYTDAAPYLQVTNVSENLTVLTPHTNVRAPGFDETQLEVLGDLLRKYVEERELEQCIAWFYTPLAFPLLGVIDSKIVIYDCMDALDAFKNASPLLTHREEQLLQASDVVFTGGPSLYQRLNGRHKNVHCFASSVDVQHFARATQMSHDPADQAQIDHPRLGYFGVIDERIDLNLIDSIAASNPGWQFVFIGPVVKIDPNELPCHPNIHYLGQKQYADLPDYLAGWDVCLLPFARNESTQFISPTKTLEYMVAAKPIVSTRITDVAVPYFHIVEIADTPAEFADACSRSLSMSFEKHKERSLATRKILENTSWDKTVGEMRNIIHSLLAHHSNNSVPPVGSSNSSDQRVSDIVSSPVVVLGAGPTGLSATYHLGNDALLLERNARVGGWCRSVERDGFTFDYAGHIMFSNDPYVHELYEKLLGTNVHWQDREAWIFSKKVYTRYPFQGALYGLPPAVIKECIMGAIESRYGKEGEVGESQPALSSDDSSSHGKSNSGEARFTLAVDDSIDDCCGDGVLESTAKLNRCTASINGTISKPSENFEEFIYRVWGKGIAKHFAVPYNSKLWAVPLSEMETSWLGGRVPMPNLGEMIEGALQPVGKPMGPNARFGYPLKGGFQALMDGFVPWIEDRLVLNTEAVQVSPTQRKVLTKDGKTYQYQQLVSTMPLPVLVRLIGDEAPSDVKAAANALRHVSVRCVNIGVGREAITEKHWIYYPEQTVFHRIFVQGNASPFCNANGGFGLTCEITYSPHKPLPCDGEELIQRCISDCIEVGLLRSDDTILTSFQIDMPYAYVVYDHNRKANVEIIRDWLKSNDIILAGRYSEWEYYNSDHAFLAGKRAADDVHKARAGRQHSAKQSINSVSVN